ncbi:hypothetical protein VD0002_g1337 [Verticillium dahliae]|uniref:HSF-type DNA-binding domain-containing protein n=1 Tax=Verticillium dahliae TaxID=27337 RepID=A0AA44WUE9_VERDA|nr:heat shock factor protein [Verticillium dahliae]PNH36340.1 hypothetical protein BJF96_g417 [Verticillium dahliae]PNH50656.1 hypothetical protein VD0003_g6529 [Verticillium dahliae]PNH68861.1 hypothetical protein VD0002_g1337 [Verticillium dahliae]
MANQFPSPTPNDLMRWHNSADAGGFVDGTAQGVNPYGMMPPQSQQASSQQSQQPYGQHPTPSPNNALARRQMNRALVPTAQRGNFDPNADPWAYATDDSSSLIQQPGNGAMNEQDSIEALEEAAQKAKRESQSKRKQIPPFVQKLSSFLDEEKNVDLIRWSDKGDSFIVLDEDEFAKTLIPELFKHNNYASFVRQLNMYGFHKRVGLSDNSMRASERKNKSPSEYSNPYFRRGHPNLLWLINKPKNGGGKGGNKKAKAPEGEVESEEEVGFDENLPQGLNIPAAAQTTRALPQSNMPLEKKEMAMIREELAKVRDQQKIILGAINRIQRENGNLYQQAAVFQEQHDRHQNSINAILNFLANVFRKTLEDQNGSQNVNELLASIIPGSMNGTMPQGSVVDLGDFVQAQTNGPSGMAAPKRARGLLPPIPNSNAGRASTVSSTPSAAPTPQTFGHHNPVPGSVTELFDTPDNTNSPDYLAQELKSNPHESMMKIIQDTNANNNTTGVDLPDVVANTPTTMTNDQRQQMLNNMMAQTSEQPSSGIPAAAGPNTSTPSFPSANISDSASKAPAPDFSLSPVMGSNPQPPSLSSINYNSEELDALRRMSQDNTDKIHHLQSMLGPLSPSGRIPGLDESDNTNNYFDNGAIDAGLDLDQYLDSDAFNDTGPFSGLDFNAANAPEFDFSLLDANNAAAAGNSAPGTGAGLTPGPAGRVHDVGSTGHNTPSPSGTEEIPRDELAGYDGSPRDLKRRRVD